MVLARNRNQKGKKETVEQKRNQLFHVNSNNYEVLVYTDGNGLKLQLAKKSNVKPAEIIKNYSLE